MNAIFNKDSTCLVSQAQLQERLNSEGTAQAALSKQSTTDIADTHVASIEKTPDDIHTCFPWLYYSDPQDDPIHVNLVEHYKTLSVQECLVIATQYYHAFEKRDFKGRVRAAVGTTMRQCLAKEKWVAGLVATGNHYSTVNGNFASNRLHAARLLLCKVMRLCASTDLSWTHTCNLTEPLHYMDSVSISKASWKTVDGGKTVSNVLPEQLEATKLRMAHFDKVWNGPESIQIYTDRIAIECKFNIPTRFAPGSERYRVVWYSQAENGHLKPKLVGPFAPWLLDAWNAWEYAFKAFEAHPELSTGYSDGTLSGLSPSSCNGSSAAAPEVLEELLTNDDLLVKMEVGLLNQPGHFRVIEELGEKGFICKKTIERETVPTRNWSLKRLSWVPFFI